jgi:hypothetical protein
MIRREDGAWLFMRAVPSLQQFKNRRELGTLGGGDPYAE